MGWSPTARREEAGWKETVRRLGDSAFRSAAARGTAFGRPSLQMGCHPSRRSALPHILVRLRPTEVSAQCSDLGVLRWLHSHFQCRAPCVARGRSPRRHAPPFVGVGARFERRVGCACRPRPFGARRWMRRISPALGGTPSAEISSFRFMAPPLGWLV